MPDAGRPHSNLRRGGILRTSSDPGIAPRVGDLKSSQWWSWPPTRRSRLANPRPPEKAFHGSNPFAIHRLQSKRDRNGLQMH